MTRHALITLLLGGAAALPAAAMDPQGNAQNGLTPTDVMEFGEISATARFKALFGSATLTQSGLEADADSDDYRVLLSGAVGVGAGLQLGFEIPYLFRGTVDWDVSGTSAEYSSEKDGFGDLTLTGTYRIMKEETVTPQWVFSVILAAPAGNDKKGTIEERVGGATTREGETAGIGSGVWYYGLGSAVSKNFGLVEPYLGFSYLFGGSREHNGVTEDRADIATLLAGSEFHLSPETTIDVRATMQFYGNDITEKGGAKSVEEAYDLFMVEASAYITIAPSVVLLAGFGVGIPDNHLLEKDAGMGFKDALYYQGMIGIHIDFGGF